MNGSEALSIIAEIALGLAGFTGVIVIFGRQPGKLTRLEAYRLLVLLSTSCAAMFLALLPFALHYAGFRSQDVWRLTSGLMAGFTVFLVVGFAQPTRRYLREAPEIFHRSVLTLTVLLHLLNLMLQLGNALSLLGEPSLGIMLFGLLWLLFHSFSQFARILFIRPEPKVPV